jgi:ribA/ribD-fused uncharacterized protein
MAAFRGDSAFLSNFYEVDIEYDGITYRSVENAYQAMKTEDMELRREIATCIPKVAKKMGRKIQMDAKKWDERKLTIMLDLLKIKFSDPNLREKLILTGEKDLIEVNGWGDKYWGVCKGKGMNMLGRLLMRIRYDLHAN